MRYLNLDLEVLQAWEGLKPAHLVLFAYIKRLCESKSEKVEQRRLPEDPSYTWVDLETMQEDLHCLKVGYDALRNAVDALVDATGEAGAHLVERQTRNHQASRRSYFRVSQAYYDREAELDLSDIEVSQREKTPVVDSQREETPVSQREKTPVAQPEKTPVYRKSIDPEKRTEKERESPRTSAPEPTHPAESALPSLPSAAPHKPETLRDRLNASAREILGAETSHASQAEKLVKEGQDEDAVLDAWEIMLGERPAGAAYFYKDFATSWKMKALKARRARTIDVPNETSLSPCSSPWSPRLPGDEEIVAATVASVPWRSAGSRREHVAARIPEAAAV